jgi:hypothetical protein
MTMLAATLMSMQEVAQAQVGSDTVMYPDETKGKLAQKYSTRRKHEGLFGTMWQPEWFDPGFLQLMHELREFQNADGHRRSRAQNARFVREVLVPKGLLTEEKNGTGIFSLPVFNQAFCDMFLSELDNYYETGLPSPRPNSMNNYGIIVNLIGMRGMMDTLQQAFLAPLAGLLFPGAGDRFDSHHAFMVKYKPDEDMGLDMHTDDSDVTFNVCLGKEFIASGLTFCGRMHTAEHRQFTLQYRHVRGRAVIHLGKHRHGADDISSGERNNLIVWSRNQEWRDFTRDSGGDSVHNAHPKEAKGPDPRCLSFTHDRDYALFKAYPKGQEEHVFGRHWAPPVEACYDRMLPAKALEQGMCAKQRG